MNIAVHASRKMCLVHEIMCFKPEIFLIKLNDYLKLTRKCRPISEISKYRLEMGFFILLHDGLESEEWRKKEWGRARMLGYATMEALPCDETRDEFQSTYLIS